MERLTGKIGGKVGVKLTKEFPTLVGTIEILALRLAAYEDSGLEPEEVADLEEAVKAWTDICTKYNVSVVQFEQWAKAFGEGRLTVLPCKVGDTVYRTHRVFGERSISTGEFKLNDLQYMGKLVFLTHEDAERALKERERSGKNG